MSRLPQRPWNDIQDSRCCGRVGYLLQRYAEPRRLMHGFVVALCAQVSVPTHTDDLWQFGDHAAAVRSPRGLW